jgi:FCD domain
MRDIGLRDDFEIGRLPDRVSLFEMAGSDVLRDAYKDLVALPFAQPSAFLAYQGERPTLSVPLAFAHRQHQKILHAIKAGDSEAAETLARDHADLARHDFARCRAPRRRDRCAARKWVNQHRRRILMFGVPRENCSQPRARAKCSAGRRAAPRAHRRLRT